MGLGRGAKKCLIAALVALAANAFALEIVPVFEDNVWNTWTPVQKGAVSQAFSDWSGAFSDPYAFNINVRFDDFMGGGSLATYSGGYDTEPDGDAIYPWTSQSVPREIIFSKDFLSVSDSHFWFDPTPATDDDIPAPGSGGVGISLFDVVTVTRHELGHAMGFSEGSFFVNMNDAPVDMWGSHITGTTFLTDGGQSVEMWADYNLAHTATGLMRLGIAPSARVGISATDVAMLTTAYGYTLNDAPTLLVDAISTPILGAAADITASAVGGVAPLRYSWKKNGQTIVGATAATLHLAQCSVGDRGVYTLTVTDALDRSTTNTTHVYPKFATNRVIAFGASNITSAARADHSIVALSSGPDHCVGLRDDGSLVAWGAAGTVQYAPNLAFVAVAAGVAHYVGIDDGGNVASWPRLAGGYAPTIPPEVSSAGGVMAVAAGRAHDMALKMDGTILAWGDNTYGQCSVPAGLTGIVAIAARDDYSLALRSDGVVFAWGDNTYGQCSVPASVRAKAIAAGAYFVSVIDTTGAIQQWGTPPAALLVDEHGAPIAASTLLPPAIPSASLVAAHGVFGIASAAAGGIIGWGTDNPASATAQTLPALADLSAGDLFAVAIANEINAAAASPVITTDPTGGAISTGGTLKLTVAATGSPLIYSWFLNGGLLPNATAADYFAAAAGSYTAKVTNPYGEANSLAAVVTQQAPYDAWASTNLPSGLTTEQKMPLAEYGGMKNLHRFAFGGSTARMPQATTASQSGQDYLAVRFARRKNGSVTYRVEQSTNLVSWQTVDAATYLVSTPTDNGDGTESVTVRASVAGNKVFMRVNTTLNP